VKQHNFFFLLVPVWDTWWRNILHIHTVWWWNLISSQWICEFSELQVLVCRKSHVSPWRRLVCACCECTGIVGPIVFPETITLHLYITHTSTPFLEHLSNYKAIFRAFWWHSNKQEIVALFTRFEPVQFSLAGMLKGQLYSYSPHMEDGMEERIQVVVLSSAALP
jgi:hypothetical protein